MIFTDENLKNLVPSQMFEHIFKPCQSEPFQGLFSNREYTREDYDRFFNKYFTSKPSGRAVYLMASKVKSFDKFFVIKIGSAKAPISRREVIKSFEGSICIDEETHILDISKPALVGHTEKFAAGESIEKRAQDIYREAFKSKMGFDPLLDRKKDWFLAYDLCAAFFSIMAAINEMPSLDSTFVLPEHNLLWFQDTQGVFPNDAFTKYNELFPAEATTNNWKESYWYYGIRSAICSNILPVGSDYYFLTESLIRGTKSSLYRAHAAGFNADMYQYHSFYKNLSKLFSSHLMTIKDDKIRRDIIKRAA